jgi:hypothetical protein
MQRQSRFSTYKGPAGGWGSVGSLRRSLTQEHVPVSGSRHPAARKQARSVRLGQPLVGEAGGTPALRVLRGGCQATSWEIPRRRVGPDFLPRIPWPNLKPGATTHLRSKAG